MDEADRTESDSVQQASLLRNRAAKMLGRAKSTGLKTLSLYYPGLLEQLEGKPIAKPLAISQSHVGLTYWSMTAWAGAISLSKDSPDVVADLPAVIQLSELVWKANPKYDHGALASMMGTLELSKPGGKAETAQKYYDLAIQWRGDQIAPLVAKAENWAVAIQNKEAFVQLLQQAIALSDKQKDLTNTVMGRRARWLLDNVDNYF
jgi:predicted anti-sigma-YlaC factor YlaD